MRTTTASRTSSPKVSSSSAAAKNPWLHVLALCTATFCFLLLFVGGLVTSHSAGLSVPDWPNSYGWNMFTFPIKNWTGGIFYEHTHRLFASFVGFLILTQAVLLQLFEPRSWVKRLGWLALLGVILQGVLGGLTVLFYLPPAISSAHAGLAQAVFCITLGLALVTSKGWNDSLEKRPERMRPGVRVLSLATAVVIFLQLIIGAVMRHTDSGLAIPTFPLAFGKLIPEFTSFGIAINFAHRVGAVAVTFMVLWTASTIMRKYPKERTLTRPAMLVVFLLGVQVMLGAITILSSKAVTPTTLHVSCGAAILGTMVLIMVRSRHLFAGPNAIDRHSVSYGPVSEPLTASIVSEA